MTTHTTRGFSTIELLIAFSIAVIFLSGIASVAFGGQTAALDTSLQNGGLFRVSTLIGDAVASTTKSWNGTPTAWQPGFYSQTNTLKSVSPCVKFINSTSTWATEKSRNQNLSLSTFIANPTEAKALGGGCDPFPPSERWDNPSSFGSSDASGAPGTGVAIATINGTRYAVATADPSSAGKEDVYIFNVTNAANPVTTGKLNTGKGLNRVAVGGNYAYVAQNDSTNQFQVINLTTPSSPSVVSQMTLPGVGISFPQGWSIAYYNNKVYIGTRETAGNEFHIYDVSNPAAPVWQGSREINHNVNDIVVTKQTVSGTDKTIAYLATSATNASAPELIALDVTTPSSISQIGSFNPSGTLYGTSVFVRGNIAYLGRQRATGSNFDFYTVDITTPSSLVEIGKRRLGLGSNSQVAGIVVQGDIAFVATTDSNKSLSIINVANPANPTEPYPTCPYNFSQVTRDIAYYGNYLFTVNRSNDMLRVIYDQPSFCS